MAKVRAAEQKVRNFEAFIRFKTIVAPYDGVVIDRNINVGDYVNKEGTISSPSAISNLFTVADVSMLRLFVSVPESFGPFLHPGMTADVTVPQLPNRHFTAKFLTVARGFDVSTRTAITVFTIDNEDRALWPGSYAKVELTAPVDRQMHHDSVHRVGVPGAWHASGRGDRGRPSALETDHREQTLRQRRRSGRGDFHERPHRQQPQRRVARRRQGAHRHAGARL